MLETSARLLRLLSLFQARRYWSGAELAGRLDVTSRTLRRDVDKLRSLGYPIHSTSGVEGGYQLGAGSQMPPLLLDDDEAVAVALGLRTAAAGAVGGLEEAAIRALSKIEQILPPRLRPRVAALQAMIVTPSDPAARVSARLLSAIAGACRDQQLLRFQYRDHGGTVRARLVEPHRLVHTGRRWYLVAWDSDRRDWRTFRVDRIESRVTPGGRFLPRELPARDLADYVHRGMWHAPRFKARIKVFTSAADLAKRLPPWIGMIEPDGAECCFLDTGDSSYESLATHLALLGADFEVSEPAEFVRHVQELADRYRRAARSATSSIRRKAAARTGSGAGSPPAGCCDRGETGA